MTQQSSAQGQLVCISQQALPCRGILVQTKLRLELQQLLCPWFRLPIELTPVHGSFDLGVLPLSLSPVSHMHLAIYPGRLHTDFNGVCFIMDQ